MSKKYYTIFTKKEYNFALVNTLRNSQYFSMDSLMDICVTDYPQRKNRFELLYCLLSLSNNNRVFTKFFVSELETVESLSGVFKSANWLEREA